MSSKNNTTPFKQTSGIGPAKGVGINVDDETDTQITRRANGPLELAVNRDPMPSELAVNFDPMDLDAKSFSTHSQSFSKQPQSFSTQPQSFSKSSQFLSIQSKKSSWIGDRKEIPPLWIVTDATVLPEFHPLERTATFVPRTSAAEVASRVSSVLRELSIQAEYVRSEAQCLTAYGVEFRVFLYQGQKDYSHGIIVEVQRRFGSSLLFHADTQAILDAAAGKQLEPPFKKPRTVPLVEDDKDEDLLSVSSSSLDFVRKLLSHQGQDAHFLALQTLSSLSDCERMGNKTAEGVATVILTPGDVIGSKVLEVIENMDGKKDEIGLRLVALNVLCNLITALKGNVSDNQRTRFTTIFAKELQDADSSPQMAFFATKGLAPLLNSSGVLDNELRSALKFAYEVGKKKHVRLMEQAQVCLQAFEKQSK